MDVLELFSGTKSISKAFGKRHHDCLTVDNQEDLEPDYCLDILNLKPKFFKDYFNVIWASPPCTCFSVASISTHWKGGHRAYVPKTEDAVISIKLIRRTMRLIKGLEPEFWFIENPRGVLRKIIDKIFEEEGFKDYKRHTVTYCSYGDKSMKPTDVWTNHPTWQPKKMCKNYRYDSKGKIINKHCHHESARRGAKTGTQGKNGARERGRIPARLCTEIVKACEKGINNKS